MLEFLIKIKSKALFPTIFFHFEPAPIKKSFISRVKISQEIMPPAGYLLNRDYITTQTKGNLATDLPNKPCRTIFAISLLVPCVLFTSRASSVFLEYSLGIT